MRCTIVLLLAGSMIGGLLPAADPAPTEPFNGKDFTGWKFKDEKKKEFWIAGAATIAPENNKQLRIALLSQLKGDFGPPQMICTGGATDIYTEEKYGDCLVRFEFMVPKESNSGIYLMGEYELQIMDSFGKPLAGMTDLGAIYNVAAPAVNMAMKPGEWQMIEIDFQAPVFEGEMKMKPAVFKKVKLNGQQIQMNVMMKTVTPGGLTGKESATGPLMFQGDHGAVAIRSLTVTPK